MSGVAVERVRRRLATLTCIFVLLFPGSAMANASPYAGIRESAASIAKLFVSDYGVDSLQYNLLYDNENIVSGTAGRFNKSDSLPVTEASIYGIGSTSKMFVTAAAMILWDQGLIDLDEPIVSYIPEFSMFACCSTIPRD